MVVIIQTLLCHVSKDNRLLTFTLVIVLRVLFNMLSKKFIFTLYNVRPKNPLLYRYGTLSSKPYISNGLFTKHVTVTLQLYQNFFTSQRLLLASKKKPGWKEDSKKGKSYTKDKIEEEEEKNINISEKERNFDLSKVEAKANIVTEKLKKDYSSMRIGRANPGLNIFFSKKF